MIELGGLDVHHDTGDDRTSVLVDGREVGGPSGGSSDGRATVRGPFASVSKVLRAIGALILLSSASAFIFQGWRSGGDLTRYGTLVSLTVVLAAAGVACGVALRESKAARTLFAVVLALLPVHATVLGALLYSQVAWDGDGVVDLPAFGIWVAPSASTALLVCGLALALLAPIVAFATRALVPPSARGATLALLGFNAALLLPVRGDWAMAAAMLALTVAALALELRWIPRASCWQTLEGRVVRLVMVAPIALMFGRAHLHRWEPGLVDGAMLIGLGAALFALARKLSPRESTVEAIELTALLPATLGWWLACACTLDRFSWLWMTLPIAAGLLVASAWSAREGRAYRRLAAVVAALGTTLQLCTAPGVGASLLCLGVGVATLAFGFFVRQKLILGAGVVAAAAGLVYQLRFAIEIYSLGRWGSLAALGLATVITAALLERYQERAVDAFRRLRGQLRGWDL